jgi:hypothetical protein
MGGGGVVVHAFNPSTQEEAGRFLSSRPAWSTVWVPGQPGLYRETLSRKRKEKKRKEKKRKEKKRKEKKRKEKKRKEKSTEISKVNWWWKEAYYWGLD